MLYSTLLLTSTILLSITLLEYSLLFLTIIYYMSRAARLGSKAYCVTQTLSKPYRTIALPVTIYKVGTYTRHSYEIMISSRGNSSDLPQGVKLQRVMFGDIMRHTRQESVFSKHRPSGPMLSISRFVNLCVCVFVCLFTFEVPFKLLFAPTSQSGMSNIFRDSESLGKSNGKKWSQI